MSDFVYDVIKGQMGDNKNSTSNYAASNNDLFPYALANHSTGIEVMITVLLEQIAVPAR